MQTEEQKKVEVPQGAETLATISVVCGVVGIFVFGVPLGIAALACGIPALTQGAQRGKTGVILGILDIVLAIAAIALLSQVL